jgi:hypothetical protein
MAKITNPATKTQITPSFLSNSVAFRSSSSKGYCGTKGLPIMYWFFEGIGILKWGKNMLVDRFGWAEDRTQNPLIG